MSDGPYRTLKLRQQWKQLLKRAYQLAFDDQDVVEMILPALERDCAWEITKDFMPALDGFCSDHGNDLFEDRNARLDELRRISAGRGTLGSVIADCAAEQLAEGKRGPEAMRQALREGLTDRLARVSKQMEEHVLREAGERKAINVRSRLDSAMGQAALDGLIDKLVGGSVSSRAAPPKHSGLEDGVGLR
ncbi:MAG: hypothetical protein KIT48_08095 [Pseudolabrys sp.]|nr:hypothetical protein [Pseudolabrys sp.]